MRAGAYASWVLRFSLAAARRRTAASTAATCDEEEQRKEQKQLFHRHHYGPGGASAVITITWGQRPWGPGQGLRREPCWPGLALLPPPIGSRAKVRLRGHPDVWRSRDRRDGRAACCRASSQHRRPRSRSGRCEDRCSRLYRGRRQPRPFIDRSNLCHSPYSSHTIR
jgi:hypothetical protein